MGVRHRVAKRGAKSRLAKPPGDCADDPDRVRDGAGDGNCTLALRYVAADYRSCGNRIEVIMAMRWYVVHAYSGFEAQVKRSLEERVKRNGMEDFFGEILVPTEEVVEMRGGQQRRSERKFFPGYVLVQMEMTDDTWHLVKDVPKVMGFIGGTGDRPAPISDKEANSILQRVQEGVEKPRPKVLFEPGEVVRVIDGPFNDFNGVVEDVDYEKIVLRFPY